MHHPMYREIQLSHTLVTESLDHLDQWLRKVLIINELSVVKKVVKKGFRS